MGRGLWQLTVGKLGKFPHECMECDDPEWAFIVAGWNDHTERENEAIKKAGG